MHRSKGHLEIEAVCILLLVFSYSYGGYASAESSQVGAQPVYSVNVQQVNTVHATVSYFCETHFSY